MTLCYRILLGVALVMVLLPASAIAEEKPAAPLSTEDHLSAAEHYMATGQWDFASFAWRNLLTADPKNVSAHLGLATTLMKANLPGEAVTHLEQARTTVKDIRLDNALAEAYQKTGQPSKAAALYKAVLVRHPENALIFKALKGLVPLLPDTEKAVVKKTLATIGRTAKAKAREAVKAGKYAEAAQYFEVAHLHYKTLAEANDQGVAFLLAGDKKGAAKTFQQLNRSKKARCQIKANGAMVLLGLGHYKPAETLMQEAINTCNGTALRPQLYNNLGYIYELGKNWQKARFAYERAAALNPGFTKAQQNLAYIYLKQRDYRRAQTLFKTLVQRNPANAAAWNQLGFTEELLNNKKAALAAYKMALAKDPSLKEAYYNLGTFYQKQGQQENALATFKKMAELEFDAMENPAQHSPIAGASKSPLLDYVDVFFSEPM